MLNLDQYPRDPFEPRSAHEVRAARSARFDKLVEVQEALRWATLGNESPRLLQALKGVVDLLDDIINREFV